MILNPRRSASFSRFREIARTASTHVPTTPLERMAAMSVAAAMRDVLDNLDPGTPDEEIRELVLEKAEQFYNMLAAEKQSRKRA